MSSAPALPWRLGARAAGAFSYAAARHRLSVASAAHERLDRWERRAMAIEEPRARALAVDKLRRERLNAEGAAMLATTTPRAARRDALEAILALEVLYDYLDGLSESVSGDALRDKRQLYKALTDAVATPPTPPCDYYRHHPFDDGGYMAELATVAAGAIARLPAEAAVREALADSAARCAEAQARAHAAPSDGRAQAEQWARRRSLDSHLEWREFLAGAASSVVGQHALIAAAGDPVTTPAHAAKLDELYLSICVVTTLLDGVVDRREDERGGGELGFLDYYASHAAVADALTRATAHVFERAREVRDGPFHVAIFVGIVAYYASAPGAASAQARATISPLVETLRPLTSPSLLLWRAWRARTSRTPPSPSRAGEGPSQVERERLRA